MTHAQLQAHSARWGRLKPVPVVSVCCWLAMLVTGTDVLNACLLAAAIAFGLMSVTAAGGAKTTAGFLNLVLVLKFLLVALILKTLTFQAIDSNLQAPRTTAKVMAIGFFGLYLGSLFYRYTTKIKGIVKDVTTTNMYLALAIVFSVVCLSSGILILEYSGGTESLAGGFWGIVHQFQSDSSFCVVPAMYYAWSSGSKLFLTHPLVLVILSISLLIGIASTTKQGVMEPMLCYLAVGFIRYGLSSKAVWSVVALGTGVYLAIIYPYSQYVRSHGGREGSLRERLEVIQEVFFNVATDASFREGVDTQITAADTYLGRDSLQPVNRLAMIGEADRLIAATDATQSYTGWETITNGLKLMVPSFIMPDKPLSGGGNFLAHITGDIAPDDFETQVSYGFMANLYNAFGLGGVLLGTIAFIFVLYYVLRLWFATPDLSFSPWGSSIWYVLLGMSFEHSLIEAPVGNNMPILINIGAVVGLIYLAQLLANFMSTRRLNPARY